MDGAKLPPTGLTRQPPHPELTHIEVQEHLLLVKEKPALAFGRRRFLVLL
jgi:hypothetical protein